jgi:hypothetical protein
LRPPAAKPDTLDDLVEVRVAVALWVGPVLFEAGEKTRMSASDAEALKPSVEII